MRRFGLEFEFRQSSRIGEFQMDGWHVKGEHCGHEIVSPPLEEMKPVRDFCRQAKRLGFYTDEDDSGEQCGLHLHIEMQSEEELVRLVHAYAEKEDYFFGKVADRRHNCEWCERLPRGVSNADNYDDLVDIIYDRYHWINPFSWEEHGTLEVRLYQGTLVYGEVSRWVRLHQAFVAKHSAVLSGSSRV